jgi:hypothetical protein
MMTLIVLTSLCCCALLGTTAALWRILRLNERTWHALTQRGPHPRMDLAAGTVRLSQHVHAAARRRGLKRDEDSTPIERASLTRMPDRADRRLWLQTNGDLSDPEAYKSPAGGVHRPLGTLWNPESR